VKQTELRLVFKRPPKLHFVSGGHRPPDPSQVVFRIDPHTGVRIALDAHRADRQGPAQIQLDMEFEREGGEDATPYEILLHAALIGDSSHFTRQDSIEAAWRVVQPLLDSPPPVYRYKRKTWGPSQADKLVARWGGWQSPWTSD
jgi:glucose-6-phosphate 1-dehydrogenase